MKFLTEIFAVCAMMTAITVCAEPVIQINPEEVIGNANPMIFGQNIEAADERGIFQSANLPKPSPDSVNTGKGHWDPVNRMPNPAAVSVMKQVRTGMLRYPGGCLAHNFDWRMAIGPIESRPDWKFGLDEFLSLCEAVDAKPLITFSDYVLPKEELPELAANLVEYLNAPARPQYPQAMKRAANGHPKPYGVKYFEIGNETYHSNHNLQPTRSYTPEEYVDFAQKIIAATKRIDPSIQLGVVGHQMNLDKKPDSWDSAIYRKLIPVADFIVHHYYAPDLYNASPEKAKQLTLYAGTILKEKLANTQRQMREYGGKTLPVKITEYNVSGAQNCPPRWQDSYLAGLNIAEMLLEFRNPESGVDAAAYWQLIGGFFGIVQRDGNAGFLYKAPWPFFRLLAEKTGDELLSVTIANNPQKSTGPEQDGTAIQEKHVPEAAEIDNVVSFNLFFSDLSKINACGSGDAKSFQIRFNGESKPNYLNIIQFQRPKRLQKNCRFSIEASFEARFIADAENTGNAALGFGLMDSRGWEATRRATAIYGLDKSQEWKKYETNISLDADCPGLLGLIRYEKPKGALKGTLEIRNLEFRARETPEIIVPLLAAEASRRKDGKIALVVINRSPDQPQEGTINFSRTKMVSGNAYLLHSDDVNSQKTFDPEVVSINPGKNSFRWIFPPQSLTIFELKGTNQQP